MKTKIISGSALAAAAIALALNGAAVTPAAAGVAHKCTMQKGSCGSKMKCMTKKGVCKHKMMHHKGSCHHMKSHCKS